MVTRQYNFILASQSPRRRSMIQWLGIPVTTTSADIDETPLPDETPVQIAARLACRKAQASSQSVLDSILIAADTVVDFNGSVLGKPESATLATQTLDTLRCKQHRVHTCVSVYNPQTKMLTSRCVSTSVWMRDYTDDEIAVYVASGDPMDKAGAYAVQHTGFHPVERLHRCYANVVGFPLCALEEILDESGYRLPVDMRAVCRNHLDYTCPSVDKGYAIQHA